MPARIKQPGKANTSPTTLDIRILTFNTGRCAPDPNILSAYLRSGTSASDSAWPDLLVLCLQEIAPLPESFLSSTGNPAYLGTYYDAFQQGVHLSTHDENEHDGEYTCVAKQNVGMTAIMVFQRLASKADGEGVTVRWMQSARVGFGFAGVMGNKGAVGVRMGLSVSRPDDQSQQREIDVTFVSAHLAPMEWAVERRNQDWRSLVSGMVFENDMRDGKAVTKSSVAGAVSNANDGEDESRPLLDVVQDEAHNGRDLHDTGIYAPSTHLFLAGDLNYRTSSTAPSTTDAKYTFPQPTPHDDDSYPRHYSHLFTSSDQLGREMKAGRTCHGLREAPVEFPPTYKYSDQARKLAEKQINNSEVMQEPEEWHWSSHRWPSWCDRILYLPGSNDVTHVNYTALPLLPSSDHRPVSCSFRISLSQDPSGALTIREAPFPMDRYWRARRRVAALLEVVVGTAMMVSAVFGAGGGEIEMRQRWRNGVLLGLGLGAVVLGGVILGLAWS